MMCLLAGMMVQGAHAAIRHTDASLVTYVDFATNSGRYVESGSTNAMLDYIRERDKGVLIDYTTSAASYTMPHGMISFDSVVDMGNATAVGYNYIVTVAHNGALNPTFNANTPGIGAEHAIQYKGVEEASANGSFVHAISGSQHYQDYKLTRLSKIVTDATSATLASGSGDMKGTLVYRVGGGAQQLRTESGTTDMCDAGSYLVGGVGSIGTWSDYTTAANDVKQGIITGQTSWKNGEGAGSGTPLPFGSTGGDSGSPYFIYDTESGSFQLLMAHTGSVNGNTMYASTAPEWAADVMDSDNVRVDMSLAGGSVRFRGVEKADDDKGSGTTDVINGLEVTVQACKGYLSKGDGTNLYDKNWNSVTFNGVESGQHTWKDLSGLKNQDNWYAYDNSYLNATESVIVVDKVNVQASGLSYSELYQTQNVVFDAAADNATYNVYVDADTDLGLGYLQFAANDHKDVVFNVQSEKNNLLNSAGYVVDKGVTVNVSLRNTDANYMREWRKVGEGDIRLCGDGKNEIFLNVGGTGKTLLEQTNGYAAYNVLVNTGSTVKIKDTNQIFRDFTFGNGGGTLDMNGNSMEWYTSGGETRTGFTINALTEESVISNSAAQKAVLTFKETGKQTFVGSFRDGKDSALQIVYDAGSGNTWELNSIHTSLQHADSGLLVNSGTVRLSGTHTVHGEGSATGKDAARYTNADDWHYADAAMNVTVEKGGTFELASHARLQGDVTVQTGGTYLMREGVNHAEEYIEGGETKESTGGDVAKYYGHKGDVKLASGALMQVSYTEGTDTATHYAGKVSGPGSLVVDLGTDAAAFVMSGEITGLQSIAVQGKSRLDLQDAADAVATTIAEHATLTLQSKTQDLVKLTADKSTATLHNVRMSSTSDTEATMEGTAENARVESARVEVQSGATLVLDKVALADDVHLVLAENAVVRMDQAAFALTATNTAGAEVGMNAAITLRGCGIPDSLTLDADSKVYSMVSNALVGAITLEGSSLLLDMRALGDLSGYDAIQFRFGDMVAAAALAESAAPAFSNLDSMGVKALMADGTTWLGFYNAQDSSSIYLAYVPEPTTATLSLLGLAALCARRRRKLA